MRILVVDDERDVGELVTRSLKRLSDPAPDCIYDSSPIEALARFAAGERFDLVVSDVDMPGMTGLEFRERLEESGHTPPFLFITGKPDSTIPPDTPLLPKPFTSQTLHAAVRRVLEGQS